MKRATRLLDGDDPKGFELRNHPKNAGAMRIAQKHEDNCGGIQIDFMDDTPEGDVCAGILCCGCEWVQLFPYRGKQRPLKRK